MSAFETLEEKPQSCVEFERQYQLLHLPKRNLSINDRSSFKLNMAESKGLVDEKWALQGDNRPPKKWFIFRHDSTVRHTFAWIVAMSAVWDLISLPYNLAYQSDDIEVQTVGYFTDVIMWLDLGMLFCTSFLDRKGNEVVDSLVIRSRYLRSWFGVDLFSSFPFEIFAYAVTDRVAQSVPLLNEAKFIASCLRLNRLFRITKIYRVFQGLRLMGIFEMLKMALYFFLAVHFAASTFYFVGIIQQFPSNHWSLAESWVSYYNLKQLSNMEKHILAISWSFSAFLQVGPGDIVPKTVPEIIWTVIVVLLGAVVYTQIVGNALLIIVKSQGEAKKKRFIERGILRYLDLYDASKRLRTRVFKTLDYLWVKSRISPGHKILETLPIHMQIELGMEMYGDYLKKVPLFKAAKVDRAFLRAIVPHCKLQVAMGKDVILETGDIAAEMSVLLSGTALMMDTRSKTAIATFRPYDIIGESVFIHIDGWECHRVVAHTNCTFISVSATVLHNITKFYPRLSQRLSNAAYQSQKQFQLIRQIDDSHRSSEIMYRLAERSQIDWQRTVDMLLVAEGMKDNDQNYDPYDDHDDHDNDHNNGNINDDDDDDDDHDDHEGRRRRGGGGGHLNASPRLPGSPVSFLPASPLSRLSLDSGYDRDDGDVAVDDNNDNVDNNNNNAVDGDNDNNVNNDDNGSVRFGPDQRYGAATLRLQAAVSKWISQRRWRLQHPIGAKYVFDLSPTVRYSWKIVVMFSIFFTSIVVPLNVAFEAVDQGSPVGISIRCADVIMILNFLFPFVTALHDEHGRVIWDMSVLAKKYVYSRDFVWNFMIAIPFDVFFLSGNVYLPRFETGDALAANRAHAVALASVMELTRLLRLRLVIKNLYQRLKHPWMNLLRVFVVFTMFCHWFCCLLYLVSRLQADVVNGKLPWVIMQGLCPDAQVGSVNFGSARCRGDVQLMDRYVVSLYFSVVTMTTVGYGDIFPSTFLERCVVSAMIFFSFFVRSFLFGSVAHIVVSSGRVEKMRNSVQTKLSVYLSFHRVSRQSIHILHRFVSLFYQKLNGHQPQKLLGILPFNLKADVCEALYYQHVLSSQLFRNIDRVILKQIYIRLRPMVAVPGQKIFAVGERTLRFYVIGLGSVVMRSGDSLVEYGHLKQGDSFGEVTIISGRATYSAVARETSILYYLTTADIEQIMALYPRVVPIFVGRAYAQIRRLQQAVLKVQKHLRLSDATVEAYQAQIEGLRFDFILNPEQLNMYNSEDSNSNQNSYNQNSNNNNDNDKNQLEYEVGVNRKGRVGILRRLSINIRNVFVTTNARQANLRDYEMNALPSDASQININDNNNDSSINDNNNNYDSHEDGNGNICMTFDHDADVESSHVPFTFAAFT